MRYLLILLSLFSVQILAYSGAVDDYDQQTGLYFHLIAPETNKGILSSGSQGVGNSNLFIYDPVSKTARNLFEHNTNRITAVWIPSFWNSDRQQVESIGFNVDVKNNRFISQRAISEKLLVETYDEKSKTYRVWTSPKRESKVELLFSYKAPAGWHYDLKHSVIRLLVPDEFSVKVSEISY